MHLRKSSKGTAHKKYVFSVVISCSNKLEYALYDNLVSFLKSNRIYRVCIKYLCNYTYIYVSLVLQI